MKKFLLLGYLWVFTSFILYAQTDPPGLTAATNATVDNDIVIDFTEDATWEGQTLTVIFDGTTLTSGTDYDFDFTNNKLTLKPGGGEAKLQTPIVDGVLQITTSGYDPASVNQTIAHGAVHDLVITTEPTAPSTNGGTLGDQPVVRMEDRYDNVCTGETGNLVASASGGAWTIGGGTSVAPASGIVTYTDLTAGNATAVTGAKITFTFASVTVESAGFDIPVDAHPPLTIPTDATVDSDIVITFTDGADWRTGITGISWGSDALAAEDYVLTASNQITLKPSVASELQAPGTKDLTIVSPGYTDAVASLTIAHGVVDALVITTEPTAPSSNGGALGDQPVVRMEDKYDNVCTGETGNLVASASGGSWTIGGGTSVAPSNGIVTYTDLTAGNATAVTGATITFTFNTVTAESAGFNIPVDPHPSLSVPGNATVDSDIVITFTDGADWRTGITGISWGTDALAAEDYVLTTPNQITLKPSVASELQAPGTKNLTIVSPGYADAVASLTIAHGAVDALVITTEPTAPSSNGGALGTQPVVRMEDKYDNTCTGETGNLVASASGGAWTIGGGTSVAPASGIVTYTNLTAANATAVTDAKITFTFNTVTAESAGFNIPVDPHPDLTIPTDATVDSDIVITFTDDVDWRTGISSISWGSDVLATEDYVLTATNQITLKPSVAAELQAPGTKDLTIVSPGYADAVASLTIAHGAGEALVITTEPTAPSSNGGTLGDQPVVRMEDKYDNVCTGETGNLVASASGGSWIIGGTTSKAPVNGVVTYDDLTAANATAVTGAKITFTFGSVTAESAGFDIPVDGYPTLAIPSDATVDVDIVITFADGADWRTNITSISWGSDVLAAEDYDITEAGKITLKPSVATELRVPDTKNLTIVSSGYADAVESLAIAHGAVNNLVIQTEPTSPSSNGGALVDQPVVRMQDQYNNTCTGETGNLVASASGGAWTIGGGTSVAPSGGIVTYTNLTAANPVSLTGAKITFTINSVTIESAGFDIPVDARPALTIPGNATVDSDIVITFTEDSDWRTGITSISWGSDVLATEDYDISEAGKITLKPSVATELRVPNTKDLTIVSSGYADAVESLAIAHGAVNNLVIQTEPTAPSSNGGALADQPVVRMQDQYNNTCTAETGDLVASASGGSWTIGGTTSVAPAGGIVTYTDLTAANPVAVTGAKITFTFGSVTIESAGFDIPVDAHPSLTVPGDATVDSDIVITFGDVSKWRTGITSISWGTDVLVTEDYDLTTPGEVRLKPSVATELRVPGTKNLTIVSSGYADAVESLTIAHGAANKLAIATQPVPPSVNGDEFNPQPSLEVRDQYDNVCTSDGARTITAAKGDAGNWTLGGTLDQSSGSGTLTFTGLTASSNEEITGANIAFSSVGITGVTSTNFGIGLNAAPNLTAASGATVDGPFEISYVDEVAWEAASKTITFDGTIVPSAAWSINSTSNKITFDPATDASLQTAKTGNIVITVDGYANATVSQTITHGAADKLSVRTEPVAPATNGDPFQTQPEIEVLDQYNNLCTSNSSASITASENNSGVWTLGGTNVGTVSSGVLSYTDLTASSTSAATDVFIIFNSGSITSAESARFNLGLNTPPELTAAANANVDGTFKVTFTDVDSWQSKITSITYNGTTVDAAAYNKDTGNEITFDPSKSTALQVAGTQNFVFVSSGFNDKSLSQTINHGAPNAIVIKTQPTAPSANGGVLATQPQIGTIDQYDNDCTSDNATNISAAKGDGGDWTLGGSPNQTVSSGKFTYTDLSATSDEAVTAAFLTFTSGSFASVNSNTFDIPVNATPALTAAPSATVDNTFEITFSDDATWRGKITEIQYGGELVPATAYTTGIGRITFDPSQSTVLQEAGTKDFTIIASGYSNATVTQEIGHGLANKMVIATQPTGPSANGQELATQPVVEIRDQYDNVCTSDNTTSVSAAESGGTWTLGGTKSVSSSSGVVTYSGLTASSNVELTTTTITFSSSLFTDVVSNTFTIPALDASPTLLSASNATVDAMFEISFSVNSSWQLAIDSIRWGNNLIDATAYDNTQSGKIVFDPSKDSDLQLAGTNDLSVYASGYETATVSQKIEHGAASQIIIALQPSAPAENGDPLATQPGITLRDQYNNDCTTESAIEVTAAKGDSNDWTLGGTVTRTVASGSVSYTDLTASSRGPVTGAFITFSATGLTSVNSNTFDIPDLNAGPALTAASGATVDGDFEVTFTENEDWRTNITQVRYGDDVLSNTAYDTSSAGKIIIKPGEDAALQVVANKYLVITSTSYLLDSVQQQIGHGTAKNIVITTQPFGPDYNGAPLATQPELKLQDQYQNDCTTDNITEIIANATGGSWTIEGTTSLSVTNGIAAYTDLTARSTDMVSSATITFSGTGLTNQESDSFLIPAPSFAPSLIASTTATVDSLFVVTFSENADWQGKIDSIAYDGTLLASDAYDKSQAGKIVFDPAKDSKMQVADIKEILVYARGYENASVNQEIKHGVPDTLLVETQPEAPEVNGGELGLQPKISLQDQYGNACTGENEYEVTVQKGDTSDWTLGGTLTQAVSSGVINYRDLTAASNAAVLGAYLTFTGNGITAVNSNTFDIPVLNNPPNLTAASSATVDNNFVVDYFESGQEWSDHITSITYAGDTLPTTAYDINSDNITFRVSDEVLLQKVGTFEIVVAALGFSNASVDQTVGHGVVNKMVITQQPLAPATNGDELSQQPILQLLDQYDNLCDTENTRNITASKNDAGNWNIAGTVEKLAVDGIVTYTELSVFSTEAVTGAEFKFSSEGLTDVVSDQFDIPDVSDPPALTAASNANVDNPFKITFTEDSVWRNRINVVTVNDSILVKESYNNTVAGELKLIPVASKFLQKVGTFQIVIQSRGFSHDTIQQEIKHGVADSILIVKQPTAPINNGEVLAEQPELKLTDQYLNDCTTDNSTLVKVEKHDDKDWVLGGNAEVQSTGGIVMFSDLTATSEIAIDSAYLKFFIEKDTVISERFTIPVPVIELTASENATVDTAFTIGASDNASWRDSISEVTFANKVLVDTAYVVEAGKITFYPANDSTLMIARKDTLVVKANGYADAKVEQIILHGITTEMVIVDQPIGPENNGDTLAQQPKIQLKDKYLNDCKTDNATKVLTAKYSDGSDADVSGLWDLGGTREITALEGVVKFMNLTATSENRVEGAQLEFTSENLPKIVSDSFDIVIPPPPVITPATNANVDESFFVEFTDNKTWRSLIKDIKYGVRSLEGRYDITIPGRITFDPTVTSILQKAGVDSIFIYSGDYDTVRFEQPILHGAPKYLVIQKEPSPPIDNGGTFIKQPQLELQDQFRNFCHTDSETPVVVKKKDAGEWTLSGTLTQIAVNGLVKYIDLIATSEMQVDNAQMEFESTGLISAVSKWFTIPEPKSNRAGEASANPELVCYGSSSNLTLSAFDGDIQWQIYDENDEDYKDIQGAIAELYVTPEIVKNERYRAKVSKEGFSTQYSNSITVSPMDPPVADFSFEIDYNQVHFTNLSENATSITWDFGDGILSSEFEPSHSYVLENVNGSGYTVTLTASNEACPDSEKTAQVFITTGIEDLVEERGLVVYPNPSNGEFFMELTQKDEDGTLRILNSSGRVVLTRDLSKGFGTDRLEFDLKDLPSGFYFITVQYPDEVLRSKLIIQ
jgi:hypothetical protein